jgi:hypothetical protein
LERFRIAHQSYLSIHPLNHNIFTTHAGLWQTPGSQTRFLFSQTVEVVFFLLFISLFLCFFKIGLPVAWNRTGISWASDRSAKFKPISQSYLGQVSSGAFVVIGCFISVFVLFASLVVCFFGCSCVSLVDYLFVSSVVCLFVI